MKAIVQDVYGDADVLRLDDVPRPEVGPGKVLVRVHAAGVDAGVWHLMAGRPYLVRAALGFRGPRARVRGLEVAGVVEEVGPDVTGFRVGDRVLGISDGSFAELAVAKAKHLALVPESVSFVQAAPAAVSGVTALQALRDAGKLQTGQTVLVIGAGGGVGTFAVQIAKAMGAEVTGVCSTSKVDLVRSIGADDVIDYTRERIAERGRRYDVVVDIAGRRPLRELRGVLAPRGTLVFVGGEGGDALTGGMLRQVGASLLSPFVRHHLRMLVSVTKQADLRAVAELLGSGQVTSAVERTYPLGEAPDAIRHQRDGRARGKVVVTVGAEG